MELLRYVGYVESHFNPFGCKICARFAPNIHYAWKSFWTNQMELLGDEAQLEARFGLFRDSAKLDAR
jgi:hypothetical protein